MCLVNSGQMERQPCDASIFHHINWEGTSGSGTRARQGPHLCHGRATGIGNTGNRGPGSGSWMFLPHPGVEQRCNLGDELLGAAWKGCVGRHWLAFLQTIFSSAWLCQQSYCYGAGVRPFQFSNFYDFFSFSLTWDPMRAKMSKRYSSSSFHPIWAKLYHKLGSHEGIKSYGRYWRSAKI